MKLSKDKTAMKKTASLSRTFSKSFLSSRSFSTLLDFFVFYNANKDTEELSALNWINRKLISNLKTIGEGGFSTVSKALYEDVNSEKRIVALKEGRKDCEDQNTSLLVEAIMLANISHKYIVEFIGCGIYTPESRPCVFHLQEYMAGGSLENILKKSVNGYVIRSDKGKHNYKNKNKKYPYDLAVAFKWCKQITDAIQYLHCNSVGIIHRDIKLGNLLLSDTNLEAADIKLADFGLAVHIRSNIKSRETKLSKIVKLSKSNKINKSDEMKKYNNDSNYNLFKLTGKIGSYMYMAPEVYKSQRYNEKADIFSLGVVFTEILTGSLLYNCVLNEKTSEQAKLFAEKVSNGFTLDFPSAFPKELSSIIKSCWNPDPSMRPSASELLIRLEAYEKTVKMEEGMSLLPPVMISNAQRFKFSLNQFTKMMIL